jgi:hypothetical protein
LYNASTFPGSSGSAVLDTITFAVLALHHAGGFFVTASDSGQKNRGALMTSVMAHLEQDQIMKVPDKAAVELWSPQVFVQLCPAIPLTLTRLQELHDLLASVPGLQRLALFSSKVLLFYFVIVNLTPSFIFLIVNK